MSNKTSPHCFVADLAREAKTIIDADNWVYQLKLDSAKDTDHYRAIDRQEHWLYDKKEAIADAASAFPANSAVGAMYQLHLIDNLASLIAGEVPEKSEHAAACQEWRQAISRMCYSVRDFIAATLDADPEDACASYYLAKWNNPHHAIAMAVARQEAKDDDAA